MIETTGQGKSAVATPDGKSRKKKKKKFSLTDAHPSYSNAYIVLRHTVGQISIVLNIIPVVNIALIM